MKKIINSKLYDTETAKEIGSTYNGLNCGDSSYCEEKLYLKKTGEFFLYGEGGPMTKYGRAVGDGYAWGESIVPIDIADAKKWVQENLDVETYVNLFGVVEE